MTLRAALADARRRLQAAGIEDAALEAEVLLRHALGLDRAHLFVHLGDEIGAAALADYEALLARRLQHEPTAYITGRREFYGLDFLVSRDTLIPRPETETLVDTAVAAARELPRRGRLIIADLGTGSGAVAVALARKLPAAEVYATELSGGALAVARANAERHGVLGRIAFRKGDLLEPLDLHISVIAGNLPYVKLQDLDRLEPEVRDFEPRVALDGGKDGLEQIRRLLRQAPRYLATGGVVCLEFGDGQQHALLEIARARFPDASLTVRSDLAGRPRVLAVHTGRPR